MRRCVWSRKPREWGGHDPRWVAGPRGEKKDPMMEWFKPKCAATREKIKVVVDGEFVFYLLLNSFTDNSDNFSANKLLFSNQNPPPLPAFLYSLWVFLYFSSSVNSRLHCVETKVTYRSEFVTSELCIQSPFGILMEIVSKTHTSTVPTWFWLTAINSS